MHNFDRGRFGIDRRIYRMKRWTNFAHATMHWHYRSSAGHAVGLHIDCRLTKPPDHAQFSRCQLEHWPILTEGRGLSLAHAPHRAGRSLLAPFRSYRILPPTVRPQTTQVAGSVPASRPCLAHNSRPVEMAARQSRVKMLHVSIAWWRALLPSTQPCGVWELYVYITPHFWVS